MIGDRLVSAEDYTDLEMDGTVRALQPWWELLVGDHDRRVVAALATQQASLLAEALSSPPGTSPVGRDPFDAVAQLAGDLSQRGLPRSELDRLLDASLDLLQRSGRALAAAGEFEAATGTVYGLFTSGGGVPKQPVDRVSIGPRGLAGDHQATRRHHGRPWQALCLWAKEKVDLLAAEGHPITYGAAGENVSVTGIDWALVQVGTRLRLGPDVLIEVAPYALPCRKNARWFLDGRFQRMHHETEPGISRIYASVLQGGSLAPGDTVVLEP